MPPSKPEFEATLTEKLMIPFCIMSIILSTFGTALTAPFRGPSGASTYKSHVGHAIFRSALTKLSRAQIQYIGTLVGDYEGWCKKNGQQPDIVTLKSGVQVFWLGPRDAKHVCLYFHGGGYSMDGNAAHIIFWHTVQQELAATGKSLSFCYVSYTLVPHEIYPKQFQECAEALQYLLTECGRKPSELLLAGDSAGGNMSLAILSHLSKPCPDVTEIKISEPLKAVVLLSPWVDFSINWPSCEKNGNKDIFAATEFAPGWAKDYLGSHKSDEYTEPLKASVDWWRAAKTEQSLCVAGVDEVLIDSIDEWVKKYKAANPTTTTYVRSPNEIHIHPVVYSPYVKNTGEQGEAIKSFLKANL